MLIPFGLRPAWAWLAGPLMAYSMIGGCLASAGLLTGCGPDQNLKMVLEKFAVPVAEKIIAENPVDDASIEGDIQGVEPGYTCEVEGLWVTGFQGKVTVYLKGTSGKILGRAHFAASQPATP